MAGLRGRTARQRRYAGRSASAALHSGVTSESVAARLQELFGVELWCGPGWHELLLDAGEQLRDEFPEGSFTEVKEKFGGLRIYGHPGSDDDFDRWNAIIREAEDRAAVTCELCGEPGQFGSSRGWSSTLCLEHRRMSQDHPRAFLRLRRDLGA